MENRQNAFLENEKIGTLMRRYAIPCIISLLVAALYNIVDQIFIANAAYLGSYGNAANTVVFPLTVVALAIAVMIGDGACAFVSISLGANRPEDAHKSIGSAVLACVLSSLALTAIYLIFMDAILTLFPLDEVEHPVLIMDKQEQHKDLECPVWDEFKEIVAKHDERGADAVGFIDRFSFYEEAKKSYAIVATTEKAFYSCVILQKGCL